MGILPHSRQPVHLFSIASWASYHTPDNLYICSVLPHGHLTTLQTTCTFVQYCLMGILPHSRQPVHLFSIASWASYHTPDNLYICSVLPHGHLTTLQTTCTFVQYCLMGILPHSRQPVLSDGHDVYNIVHNMFLTMRCCIIFLHFYILTSLSL